MRCTKLYALNFVHFFLDHSVFFVKQLKQYLIIADNQPTRIPDIIIPGISAGRVQIPDGRTTDGFQCSVKLIQAYSEVDVALDRELTLEVKGRQYRIDITVDGSGQCR